MMEIDPLPKRYVKGVCMTKFGLDDRTTMDLSYEAISGVLDDAQTSLNDIEAAVISTVDTKVNDERQRHYPPLLASMLRKKYL